MNSDPLPKQLETILKAYQHANLHKENVREIVLAWSQNTGAKTPEELIEKIYDHLISMLSPDATSLIAIRDREMFQKELSKKFQVFSKPEQELILVYCRYFYEQECSMSELSQLLNISERQLRRYILSGLNKLSRSLTGENPKLSHTLASKKVFHDFPKELASQPLFGIEPILKKALKWFTASEGTKILSLEGIGGIGKTTVAQKMLSVLDSTGLDNLIWVSARQQEIMLNGELVISHDAAKTLDGIVDRISHKLGQNPVTGLDTQKKLIEISQIASKYYCLFVVDNLETVEDAKNIVPELLKLAGKSRVIFTSRQSLKNFSSITTISIPELSFPDAVQLMDSEVERQDIGKNLVEETTRAIYKAVGGIPLALKLVISQLGYLSEKDVLHNLALKQQDQTQNKNLYKYIYRQSWMLLDDQSKKLLLSMVSVSTEGETAEFLKAINGFSHPEFASAVEKLRGLSLVEVGGTIKLPLYRIHRLTSTFLKTNILSGWG